MSWGKQKAGQRPWAARGWILVCSGPEKLPFLRVALKGKGAHESWPVFKDSLLIVQEQPILNGKKTCSNRKRSAWPSRKRLTQPKGKKEVDGGWKKDRLLSRNINATHEHAQGELRRPKFSWSWNWWRVWKEMGRTWAGPETVKASQGERRPSDKWERKASDGGHGEGWDTQVLLFLTLYWPGLQSQVSMLSCQACGTEVLPS